MIRNNFLGYIEIKYLTQIGGYIKDGTLCNPLYLFHKANIYANVKKRLYDLLFNVIKKYTCN